MRLQAYSLLILALLASAALAWSPKTQEYFCEEAVISTWGAEVADECLHDYKLLDQKLFCGSIVEPGVRDACLSLDYVVHPANLPDYVFNDTARYHIDYFDCPIKLNLDRKYLCGNDSFRPAIERSEQWFAKAREAETKCEQVRLFCVGANYLTGRALPTNRVKGKSVDDCESDLKAGVEKKILMKGRYWVVREFCKYEYQRPLVGQMRTSKYSQDYTITEESIKDVIDDLTAKAATIKLVPSSTTSIEVKIRETTTTREKTTTSIDETEKPVASEPDDVAKKFSGLLSKSLILLIVLSVAAALIRRRKKNRLRH